MVTFNRVSLAYRTDEEIFWDLSLNFNSGAFYFLTGSSGSGKTSLLKLIYMDVMPTQGSVTVLGHDSLSITQRQIPYLRQKIGMVFQDCYMLNHLTLIENVALPLRIRGLNKEQALYNASEMLSWVGLSRYINHYPDVLSGGQKQRAAVARAVINRPLFLLADEPTGNVDKENAVRILHLFEELHKRGTTVIFATHDRSLAASYPYPELLIKDKKIQMNEKTAKRYHGLMSQNMENEVSSQASRSNVIIGSDVGYKKR
ncbi:MAG: ATP-binding cassette domain-containing protein [Candidatus Paracaedibacteraceae bacterium]|nr:ATP-binding cassette domain-containing protein [Candidatus Paracaedibacteraceae bacterium]